MTMSKDKELPWHWKEFLKEGDMLFEYMTTNFESMFDGDKIKHFNIVDGISGSGNAAIDVDQYMKAHIDDIQKELVVWIKKEYEEGRLFQKELWKPFRDCYVMTSMFLGYKRMFRYRNSYTQISLISSCEFYGDCEHCIKDYDTRSFSLLVYGWNDEFCTTLRPYDVPIPDSETMIMPECIWKRM
jgi:hypothetical protein